MLCFASYYSSNPYAHNESLEVPISFLAVKGNVNGFPVTFPLLSLFGSRSQMARMQSFPRASASATFGAFAGESGSNPSPKRTDVYLVAIGAYRACVRLLYAGGLLKT